jgi:hypothetical protein
MGSTWRARCGLAGALVGLACAVTACADLLGTDFSGDPRGPDASTEGGEAQSAEGGAGSDSGSVASDAASDHAVASGPDGGSTLDGAVGAVDAATVYCGFGDDGGGECLCTNTPANGVTLGAACAATSVAGPSLCCAVQGWPSPNIAPGWAGCVCSSIHCEVDAFGDVCQCGFAAPSNGDKPVTSCTGWASCCRGKSTYAPTCACYKQSIPCQNGDEPVPSCAPSDLQCVDLAVPACN